MRILLHDFAGHAFPVHLSRELARRGHEVLHLFCASVTSPRGALSRRTTDPASLTIEGISLDAGFERYSPLTRIRHERQYGNLVAARLAEFRPEVLLSSNTPLLSQRALFKEARRVGAIPVYWLQDLLGVGIQSTLARRFRLVGRAIGAIFRAVERGLLRQAEAVIAISEDFVPILENYGVARDRISLAPNWAPVEELPFQQRGNGSFEPTPSAGHVLLYAGTLGLKHDPTLLLQLAERLGRPDTTVVVVSEGMGADWLRAQADERALETLKVLPYRPYEELPSLLGSADILLAILEADAGVFSVPSKLLTYLCAGRPIVAAVPRSNLSFRVLEESQGGIAVDPSDSEAFIRAAESILADDSLQDRLGSNARNYAERTFKIERIADNFESILYRSAAKGSADGVDREYRPGTEHG